MASTADTAYPPTATPRADANRGMPGTAPPDGVPPVTSGGNAGQSSPAGARPGDDVFGRVVQGAHETIDRVAETAAPHVHRLQESVASASDQLHHRAGQARELGDEWAESLRCTVREHPLAALATAVAVGVLLARVTQR